MGFELTANTGNNSNANNGSVIVGWDFVFTGGGFAGWNAFIDPDIPSNQEGSTSLRFNNTTITTHEDDRTAVTLGSKSILDAEIANWFNNTTASANSIAID